MNAYWRTLSLTSLLLLTGCMVTSLNPIYTEKDLVFWPGLVGSWEGDKEGEVYTFERVDNANEYLLKIPVEGATIEASAHLTTIKSRTYLDITVENGLDEKACPVGAFMTPVHVFYMVELNGDILRIRNMSFEWAKERREKGHLWIAHVARDDSTLLTADTERVQRFLRRWENSKDAWEEWTEIKRAPAAK